MTIAIVFSLPSLAGDRDESDCHAGLENLLTYKKTWGERIDRETGNSVYCASVGSDARARAPKLPADCNSLSLGQISSDFRTQLLGLFDPNESADFGANVNVMALLQKAENETLNGFDAKCSKGMAAQSNPNSASPATGSQAAGRLMPSDATPSESLKTNSTPTAGRAL